MIEFSVLNFCYTQYAKMRKQMNDLIADLSNFEKEKKDSGMIALKHARDRKAKQKKKIEEEKLREF